MPSLPPLRRLVSLLLFAADGPEKWDGLRELARERNFSTLSFFSVLFTAVLAAVSVASLFVPSMRRGFPVYLSSFVIALFLLVTTRIVLVKEKFRRLSLPYLYVMLFLSCSFGIAIGRRWENPMAAVTFIVLLVIAPLMICDKPWRIDVSLVLILAGFMLLDRTQKPPEIFAFDVMNAVTFFFISVLMSTYNQVRYVKEFSSTLLIRHQRDTDALTGVLTKSAFELSVRGALESGGTSGVLMILDIDDFKSVNDTLGHAEGDRFIAQTGRTLLSLFCGTGKVGRFGGDEFVLFVPDVTTPGGVSGTALRMRDSLREAFARGMDYPSFSVSIGCAFFFPGDDYGELFRRMDGALYEAKRAGKDCFRIFGEQDA